MGPVEGVLVLMAVAVALVGVGYLLGRTWPLHPKRGPARRGAAPDSQRGGPLARTAAGLAAAPVRTRRPPGQRAMDERLRREMEHVQALRHARENAEPWHPPAVDAVVAAAERVWFADTAVEPHTPRPAP